MPLVIDKAGPLTTVQDLGRTGFRRYGVALAGAMDPQAAQIANLLLNNPAGAPLLEYTLVGPSLEFEADTLIALAGGRGQASLDDQHIPHCTPVAVRAGQRLRLGPLTTGCRGYLAVKGGFILDETLGSVATDCRAGLGGLNGQALARGDRLAFTPWRVEQTPTMTVSPLLSHYPDAPLRWLPGHQANWFSEEGTATLDQQVFHISNTSNRMGYRLEGASIPRCRDDEPLSNAVVPGTIQVAHDGQPIVLMQDSQPTGGYPSLGQVMSVDLPRLAQLRPGDEVRFMRTDLERAQALLHYRSRVLSRLALASQYRWRSLDNIANPGANSASGSTRKVAQ